LLPAAVGLAIMLGWTVPLEFGAAAGLASVAVIKLGAAAWGIASSIRAPRPAVPASGIHL